VSVPTAKIQPAKLYSISKTMSQICGRHNFNLVRATLLLALSFTNTICHNNIFPSTTDPLPPRSTSPSGRPSLLSQTPSPACARPGLNCSLPCRLNHKKGGGLCRHHFLSLEKYIYNLPSLQSYFLRA